MSTRSKMLAQGGSPSKPDIQSATIVYATNPNQISIKGINFGASSPTVVLNSIPLNILSFSPTAVVATLPANLATGSYELDLTNIHTQQVGSLSVTIGAAGPSGPERLE
jgi:hypothetical protein